MEFRYSFLLIATIFVGLTYGQLEDMQYDKFRTKRYCGSHLAQALSVICRGNYYTIHKKQDIYQKKTYWDPQYAADMPADNLAYPFQKRSEATSIISNYRRRKRQGHGVYNECCEKSCTHDELSSYCAQPYKRRR
ncbi:hypothetical protein NQ314_020376 [Rhamnusium bicolor]|uniref:Insulin-like domain-containing protein n=1 Tax=Rhamnusium bicolor TaxID=1586634 RepID=A0AAV8WL44_9CUCU|nr:hypothetical protein NQ314_020376 [Rhamnusium bicolor]